MYLFFRPGDNAFVGGMFGLGICFIASIFLVTGLIQVASEDSRESGKKTLTFSLILLLIGIGVCGLASGAG